MVVALHAPGTGLHCRTRRAHSAATGAGCSRYQCDPDDPDAVPPAALTDPIYWIAPHGWWGWGIGGWPLTGFYNGGVSLLVARVRVRFVLGRMGTGLVELPLAGSTAVSGRRSRSGCSGAQRCSRSARRWSGSAGMRGSSGNGATGCWTSTPTGSWR